MSTFLEVENRIVDDLNRSDLSTAGGGGQIRQQIKLAIKHFRTYPFWFNEARASLSASQAYVAVPTDFLYEQKLHILIGGVGMPLKKLAFDDVLDNRPTGGGRPTAYTYYGDRFEFNRSCDTVYTLPLYYIKELAALSVSADTNEWLISGEDLIVFRTEKIIYSQILKDMEKATTAAALERDAFKALMRFRDQRVGTGYAKAHE